MLSSTLFLSVLLVWNTAFAKGGFGLPLQKVFSRINSIEKSALPALTTAVSPLILLALSTSRAEMSQLNKKAIHVSGPFFQGWLLRVIDHDQSLSAICIVGSFSARKQAQYTENYVFCAVDSPSMTEHAEMFIDSSDVSVGKVSNRYQALDIKWESREAHFTFNDTHCTGQFNFPGKFSITFNATDRIQWAPQSKHFSFGGPEGWLGMMSSLMPCHYFVHSVGSRCFYLIQRANQEIRARPRITPLFGSLLRRFVHQGRTPLQTISGQGFAHIEGNHGTAFPEGWIWSQGIAVNNTASYSLALGKFAIAGMTPTNCVLYLRRTSGETVVVRTTDLDQMSYTTNATDGSILLLGTSVLKRFKMQLSIQPQGSATAAFSVKVQIPTVDGFTQDPGCKETYTALATVKYTDTSAQQPVEEEYLFPLSALEYGGSFLQKLLP